MDETTKEIVAVDLSESGVHDGPNLAAVLILFGKYSGTEVLVDGEEVLILSEDDILAVVD